MILYRVVRASGGGRRGGMRALTALVGREEELDLLTRRWERARKGEGQLALIVGEPGLGKSRLMEEFHARLARPRTPGSSGRRRNCCRTRRCTRSPNGAASASARICPPGSASRTLNTHCAGRPRPSRICASARASGRCPLAGGSRRETSARGIAAPTTGGDDRMDSRVRAIASSRARLRGPPLGRPDFARPDARAGRARRAGAVAHRCDDASRVPPALERALAP